MEPGVRARRNRRNGSTALGLLIARVGRAQVSPGPDGLLLAERLRLPVRAPFTVGDVVLSRGALEDRPALLRHEGRHAEQWARWGGVPFLPAYGLAALWSWLRTGDRAHANPFEIAAGLEDGGYS